MTPVCFATRVTFATATIVAALALAAFGVVGVPASIGVLTGGALAIANFWGITVVARSLSGAGAVAWWRVSAALRLVAVGAVCGVMLWTGVAHPVAVITGLTVLPCALVALGLRNARAAATALE